MHREDSRNSPHLTMGVCQGNSETHKQTLQIHPVFRGRFPTRPKTHNHQYCTDKPSINQNRRCQSKHNHALLRSISHCCPRWLRLLPVLHYLQRLPRHLTQLRSVLRRDNVQENRRRMRRRRSQNRVHLQRSRRRDIFPSRGGWQTGRAVYSAELQQQRCPKLHR